MTTTTIATPAPTRTYSSLRAAWIPMDTVAGARTLTDSRTAPDLYAERNPECDVGFRLHGSTY